MIEYISLVLCIILIIIVIFCLTQNSCLQDETLFPELYLFQKYNNLIVEELDDAIVIDRWTNIYTIDKLVKKQFNDDPNDSKTIIEIINYTYEPLSTDLKSVKMFILLYFGIVINENVKICPNITALVNGVPNVMNAMIMSVTPHTVSNKIINVIKDSTITCLMPLTPYDSQEGVVINGSFIRYIDLFKERKYIVFNTKCSYQLWNSSGVTKYVLIMDIIYL